MMSDAAGSDHSETTGRVWSFQDSVIAGTATAAAVVTVVLAFGYGLDRLGAAVGLGVATGLVLAIPILAVYFFDRLRVGNSTAEVRPGWVEFLTWSGTTLLIWVGAPWYLFAPHWSPLDGLLIGAIPIAIQLVAVCGFLMWGRNQRRPRSSNSLGNVS